MGFTGSRSSMLPLGVIFNGHKRELLHYTFETKAEYSQHLTGTSEFFYNSIYFHLKTQKSPMGALQD